VQETFFLKTETSKKGWAS